MLIREFEPDLAVMLPATYSLLVAANLNAHPSVTRIVLHGSRGLARNWRAESDVDLTLIVDRPPWTADESPERLMREVLKVTQDGWCGTVEADLAVVFDVRDCGLVCFAARKWRDSLCSIGGVDCFGLFKDQRGYAGLVWNAGVQVRRMYPCLTVWRRLQGGTGCDPSQRP
jgi:hypothetical protein